MQNEQLLQKINSPADLKMLTLDEEAFSRRDQAADH